MSERKQSALPDGGEKQFPKWARELGAKADGTYTGKRWADRTSIGEKLAIACFIAEKVMTETWSVFFDAGSTVRLVAQAAFNRASLERCSLMATTNNMDISDDYGSGKYDLAGRDVTVQLTGGRLDRNHHALFGELAAATLQRIEPESIIMGISGFTFTEGLFYRGGSEEGMVKRALYTKEVAQRIVVLEHSKLGKRDMFPCLNYDDEAIEGLCKNVREKTLVVTSAPPDMESDTLDVRAWNDEIGYLEGNTDGLSGKKLERIKEITSCLNKKRILEVIVVSARPDPPYYAVDRMFPSAPG